MKLTICTPTYNRSHLIRRLYESLKQQCFQDFEWLIVDDGSQDNTKETIQQFIEEHKINIQYYSKQNGGKHTAINEGLKYAKGELFWIVDSDDYIVQDALEIIWRTWTEIDNRDRYAGIAGLKGHSCTEIIGNTIEGTIDADVLEYRYRKHITGDKSEVYVTQVLRQYKFPEYEGERYLTEAVVWNRIANDGLKLRWFSKVIYICEYLEGGLTNTSDKNIMESWQGTTLYYKELLAYKQVSLKDKILNGARAYLYYCYEKKIGFKGIFNITKNPLYIAISYVGYASKVLKRKIQGRRNISHETY